jgi:hypothetical protein
LLISRKLGETKRKDNVYEPHVEASPACAEPGEAERALSFQYTHQQPQHLNFCCKASQSNRPTGRPTARPRGRPTATRTGTERQADRQTGKQEGRQNRLRRRMQSFSDTKRECGRQGDAGGKPIRSITRPSTEGASARLHVSPCIISAIIACSGSTIVVLS